MNVYPLHSFARSFVSLSRQIDGRIGLQWQHAELKLCGAFGQSPQPKREGTTGLELVGNELTVGIEAGTGALGFYAEKAVCLCHGFGG